MGDPGDTSGLAKVPANIQFSIIRRPALRTPRGEERLARIEEFFRGGRATARLYRLKPAPPLLRRNAETPDLEKYFRGK